MQRLALPLALVVLAVLGGLLLLPSPAPPAPEPEPEAPWDPFRPEAVRSIAVLDKGDTGTLLERNGAAWTVRRGDQAPTAARSDQARWGAVALSSLRPIREVADDGDAGAFGLGPMALRIEVSLDDGSTRTLRLGDPLRVGEGRYARFGDDDRVWAVPMTPLLPLLVDPEELQEVAP